MLLAGLLAAETQPANPARTGAALPDRRLALLDAMSSELARAMERLRLPGYEPPFFVSYQLREVQGFHVAGRHGAVTDDRWRQDRRVAVDVRVGSYALDSSGADDSSPFLGPDGPGWLAPRDAPLDDDPLALRNTLWLVTDEKYKEALSSWFKKRGKGVFRPDGEEQTQSFSREQAQHHVDPPLAFSFHRDRWRREAREVTALLRGEPEVFDATMKVDAEKQVRWFTSSEGSALVTEVALFGVHLLAVARAADGQLLENTRDWYGRTEADLPGPTELRAEARRLAAELLAMRQAPALDPYTGPAVLSAEATGVLFHEAVGHRLEGDRQDDDHEGRTFKGQVGKVVLPTFLSVVDDPTLASAAGFALNGHYDFDDQGIPAQRAVLVRDGRLEGFLLSRKPVKPFEHSNGHARSQGGSPPVARMANLVVTSTRQVPMAELKRMLVAEAKRQGKPYGLIVREVSGGNTNTATFGYQAFKGTPRLVYRVDVETGQEELVRGVELVGTPLAAVNKVLASGDEVRAFNGYCGAESGYVPVSTIAPAVLVSENRAAAHHPHRGARPAPARALDRGGAAAPLMGRCRASSAGRHRAQARQAQQERGDAGQVPHLADPQGRGAEPQHGNGVSGVVAVGEILEVAMIARDHERVRVPEPVRQRPEHPVEPGKGLERSLHGSGVPGLVGLEELEEDEVVVSAQAEQDRGRILRGSRRKASAVGVRAGTGDVVRERPAIASVAPRAEAPPASGEGHGGRGRAGAAPDQRRVELRLPVGRQPQGTEVGYGVSVREGGADSSLPRRAKDRARLNPLAKPGVGEAEQVGADRRRSVLPGEDGPLAGRGLRPPGNPQAGVGEGGAPPPRQGSSRPVAEARQEEIAPRQRVHPRIRSPGTDAVDEDE